MASIEPWQGRGRRSDDGGEIEPWSGFSTPFSSAILDPFRSSSSSSSGPGPGHTLTSGHVKVDWCETDKAHIFSAELPGLRKEEMKVQVEEEKILKIMGERSMEMEEKDPNHKWHCVERQRGGFIRRFQLPENVNLDEIKCSLATGILTVEVPKKEMHRNIFSNIMKIDVA